MLGVIWEEEGQFRNSEANPACADWVTTGKLINLSVPQLLICKVRIITGLQIILHTLQNMMTPKPANIINNVWSHLESAKPYQRI